jgi:hypothetical protein
MGARTEKDLIARAKAVIPHAKRFAQESGVHPDLAVTQTITEIHRMRIWHFHPARHYFLHPGLMPFLLGSTTTAKDTAFDLLPDIAGLKGELYDPPHMLFRMSEEEADAIKEAAVRDDVQAVLDRIMRLKPDTAPSGFFLHFPLEERQKSIFVIPRSVVWGGSYADSSKPLVFPMDVYITDGVRDCYRRTFTPNGNELCEDVGKIVAGFALYMDAFPETVRDMQTPREVGASPKVHRGTCSYVGMSDVIKRELRNSTSPHWRNGHLRNLRSERFTKKRGQSVWVSGSFVKGKAKEVLSPDEC